MGYFESTKVLYDPYLKGLIESNKCASYDIRAHRDSKEHELTRGEKIRQVASVAFHHLHALFSPDYRHSFIERVKRLKEIIIKKNEQAAVLIQKHARDFIVCKRIQKKAKKAIVIQKHARGFIVRKRIQEKAKKAIVIQRKYRSYLEGKAKKAADDLEECTNTWADLPDNDSKKNEEFEKVEAAMKEFTRLEKMVRKGVVPSFEAQTPEKTSPQASPEVARAPTPEVPASPEVTKQEEMLKAIGKRGHSQLREIFESLFATFKPSLVKNWQVGEESGHFTLELTRPTSVWVPSPKDKAGAVLVLGAEYNKWREDPTLTSTITGTLSKGKIEFKSGFHVHVKRQFIGFVTPNVGYLKMIEEDVCEFSCCQSLGVKMSGKENRPISELKEAWRHAEIIEGAPNLAVEKAKIEQKATQK